MLFQKCMEKEMGKHLTKMTDSVSISFDIKVTAHHAFAPKNQQEQMRRDLDQMKLDSLTYEYAETLRQEYVKLLKQRMGK